MDTRPVRSQCTRRISAHAIAALACALVLLLAAQASASGQGSSSGGLAAQQPTPPAAGGFAAALEECVTSTQPEQRAVAFSAEMTALPGTMRMAMRIDLQERVQGEAEFHNVTAAGLGVWRSSDAKVKVYKYLKQVTNLSSPASYRAFVRFRWLNSKGHAIKRTDRLTGKCQQPSPSTEPTEPSPASGPTTPNSSATTPGA